MIGKIHSTPKVSPLSPILQFFPSVPDLHVSTIEHKVGHKMSPDTGDRYGGHACPLIHSPVIIGHQATSDARDLCVEQYLSSDVRNYYVEHDIVLRTKLLC